MASNPERKPDPGDLTAGTRRKVWWRCDKGHEWQASVLSRTSLGNGCPVCA
ncbi:zinc-ribbon domain-containing protein [Flavonifractor plautii]|nr:zinc-ribbon domain-containing protein [Flavonifractor plautii]